MNLNKNLLSICLVLVGSFLFSANTFAATPATSLKVVGEAEMRWLMFPVYRVTLKTKDGQYQKNSYPQLLDVLYLRSIDKQDLLTATDGEWKGLGVPLARRQEWVKQLGSLWPSIKRGDRLAFQVDAKGQNYFTHNGKNIGGVSDAFFGEAFLAIWLSPNTSRPAIRQQLISGS